MIYAFYSFKGGVGRSMALANIAEIFHESGLRVVMIDWDLEAPGIETYFHRGPKLTAARAHPGLIDMLMAYRTAYPEFAGPRATAAASLSQEELSAREEVSAMTRRLLSGRDDVPKFLLEAEAPPTPMTLPAFLGDLYRPASPSRSDLPGALASSPFQAYLQCIHPPDTRENGLYLISAGARPDERFGRYAAAVQDFDWTEFYAAYEGREYFSWFRNQLRSIAHVVLIDSRTGVTEMGGVCTQHIPDAVVSFCAPNFQNVDGIVRVVSGLNRADVKQARGDDRSVEVMVVPTRIDDTESDRLGEFSELFAEKIEHDGFVPAALQDLDRPLWHLQIPYAPRYNYREERVVGPGIASRDPVTLKLIAAYRRIAVHLAVLAPEEAHIRELFAGEIATALPHLVKTAPQMAPLVSEAWVERPVEVQALKSLLLTRAETPQVSRVAVCGAAGNGKTSLVARVCRDPDVVRAYPDGILWVTAARHWTAGAAQEWLREALGVSRRLIDRGLQQIVAGRRFLIVADDVWDLGDVQELLRFGDRCTQLVITRDFSLASHFGQTPVPVGTLTPEEGRRILKTDDVPLAEGAGARTELIERLLTWPLSVTLLRTALDRRLAQGDTPAAAWQALRDAFRRHEITAFDPPGAGDRTTSVAQSLRETFSRLTSDEKSVLIRVARDSGGIPLAPDLSRDLGRLTDLGLVYIDERQARARVDPLIQAYLLAEGELDEQLGARVPTQRVSSSTDKRDAANPDVERAKGILRGETATLDELQQLAGRLKDGRYFGYARRLFARARQHPDTPKQPEARVLKLVQQHALCTYRDPDLPENRFADALTILEQGDLTRDSVSAETLGLAGAIYKYQWKLSGRRRDLERSLSYYAKGAMRGVDHDQGYTAINAAFVLDVLAKQEETDTPDVAQRHRDEASALREKIMTALPALRTRPSFIWLNNEYWFFATLAEACFGLARHDEARYWLREGLPLNPPEWQLESMTRQLVALAEAQKQPLKDGSDAYRTLRLVLGDAPAALRAITMGKVGVALSGGGFRASLFHIGVLARLAELDLLRHIDVLSCVSGGSIVGAQYYLEVRHLLQQKGDRLVSRGDYVEIVRRLEREFLAGTQHNLRTRLFASWWANLRSILQRSYTRTTHLGNLFERYLYARVADGHAGPRWLNDLYTIPKDSTADFNPKIDNWRRSSKVPILIFNATTLNTGHNWQFAVSWMGEPPLGASSPVDSNEIWRRMYYWEAPTGYRRLRLGQAVVASACVPTLFDPIEFNGLFPERSVRLVDGGVHDNQGIAGLLEQECTVIIVSDASGQTNTDNRPSSELAAVALRANNILMGRVREAEFRELDVLRRSSALGGLVYLHLKKDLDSQQIDWVDCQDPYEAVTEGARSRTWTMTSYGIPRTVQRRLAGIRTDLDSFSDSEAYALMLDGYRMAETEIARCLPAASPASTAHEHWRFLDIEDVVTRAPERELEHAALLRTLSVSASRGFKAWRARPGLLVALLALIAALAAGVEAVAVANGVEWWIPIVLAFGAAMVASLALAVGTLTIGLLHRLLRSRKSLTVISSGLVMVSVGWIFARIYLWMLDGIYLRAGRLPNRTRVRDDA